MEESIIQRIANMPADAGPEAELQITDREDLTAAGHLLAHYRETDKIIYGSDEESC